LAQKKFEIEELGRQRELLEKENSLLSHRFQQASISEKAKLGVVLKRHEKKILAMDAQLLKSKKEKLLSDIEILQRKKKEGALTVDKLKNAAILIGRKNDEIRTIGEKLKEINVRAKTLDDDIVLLLENEVIRLETLKSSSQFQAEKYKKANENLIEELQSQKKPIEGHIKKIDSFKNNGNEPTPEMIANANRLKGEYQGKLNTIRAKIEQLQRNLQPLTR
jgi:hypothetical protein